MSQSVKDLPAMAEKKSNIKGPGKVIGIIGFIDTPNLFFIQTRFG
jgi:hypothetical protein